MSAGTGADDGTDTFLIGGDQSCEHDDVAFEGADGGGNEYYSCADCGGAILRQGGNAYRNQERGHEPHDDDRLRDETTSKGVLTNPQAYAAIRGWFRSFGSGVRGWGRFVARRVRGEDPEYDRDGTDGGSFDIRAITGEEEMADTDEHERGRGGDREW